MVRPLFEKIFIGHVRTVAGNVFVKFEVRICNHVAAKAFNPQNLGGHASLATPSFRKILKGSCLEYPWEHDYQI